MNKKRKQAIFGAAVVLIALTLLGVFAAQRCNVNSALDSMSALAPVEHTLRMPQPPGVITDDSTRHAYVVKHYWDDFDFADASWVVDTTALEQTFANYAWMLNVLPMEDLSAQMKNFFHRTEECPALRDRLYEIAEKYFYEPNSPYRNEKIYIPILEAQIDSPGIDSLLKIRPRILLELARKNRPGMRAADFAYSTPAGAKGRLSELKSKYTLLYFYNPDCADCKRVSQYITSSQVLAQLIESRQLTILAIYTDDQIDLWRQHLSEIPKSWKVGHSTALRDGDLYDLKAIPCLYLLDNDKKVMGKDTQIEIVENYFQTLLQPRTAASIDPDSTTIEKKSQTR